MAVTSQGKKSIWEEFRKFCKDDDIPGETLSKETLFRVEEPFNDPVPPLVAETPDLISRCHPERPYDDDRPKADRRTDGYWIGYPKKLMNGPMPLTMIWMSTNLRRLFRMMSGLAPSQSCKPPLSVGLGKRLPTKLRYKEAFTSFSPSSFIHFSFATRGIATDLQPKT